MYHLIRAKYFNKNSLNSVSVFISLIKQRDMSSDSFISVSEDENTKIATLKMQRAPVNSMNMEFLQQFTSAIKELEKKCFRGIIISSSCPTVFSAGLDIMELYKPKEDRLRGFWTSVQEMWKTLYLTPLITIAAINGHAPAGACILSLSCDYSIMVNSKATIGITGTKLGMTAPKWFRTLLVNNIGFHKAERALSLGTLFTPEEALAINLVDELAESQEELMPKVQSQMEKWLKIPDHARQATKQGLRQPFVDELISYEKQEIEDIIKFTSLDPIQKSLGKYIQALKTRKR